MTNLVIKFRMEVWGNDSMDLCTQHHMCCDTSNRKTFSNFHLNASWPERNELTKCTLNGHLGNFVIRFRMQVWGNDSMDLFAQHNMCCDTADCCTFSYLSFECLSDQMEWVDQITFNSKFEWIFCPIQTQSVRPCFHALY